ncbi:hypothetical protein CDD83_4482 [Cordyceps sp. RAO-2017]|nr:hypothetical protein CDD83_4482 [Cordyceps sp. RAO-2017]
MRLGALFAILIATSVSGTALSGQILHPEEDEDAKAFVDKLQRNFVFNWDNAPWKREFLWDSSSSCGVWWSTWWTACGTASFYQEYKLVEQYLPSREARNLVKSAPQYHVHSVPVEHAASDISNKGQRDLEVTTEESLVKIDSTSEGWNVGAQVFGGISAPYAGGPNGGISVSGGYSKDWTSGEYRTKGTKVTRHCPPGFHCTVQTWTYHVKFMGHCRVEPVIDCGGDRRICEDRWSDIRNSCPAWRPFRNERCNLWGNGAARFYYEPCEVQTPIITQVGEPMSRRVYIETELPSHRKSMLDEDSRCGETPYYGEEQAPVATGEKSGSACKLNNGDWYDPEDRSYHSDGKWRCKSNVPKPVLDKCVHSEGRKTDQETRQHEGGVARAKRATIEEPESELPRTSKMESLDEESGSDGLPAKIHGGTSDGGQLEMRVEFLDREPAGLS